MLQVVGIFEHVLAYLLGTLRQDDGLKLVAVGEHEVAHLVVLLQIVVAAPALVGMLHVLLDLGTVEVQVAQASGGRLAVVHIGTAEEAEHTHVNAVERTFHHQRVDVLIVAHETGQELAVHLCLQSQFLGQFTHLGGLHIVDGGYLCIADDIVLVLAPFFLVGFNGIGRHVDLAQVFTVEEYV